MSFFLKISVSKVDPCGVCGEWVGYNSIQCTKCQRWVHRHCSYVPIQVSLLLCQDAFACRTCLGHNCSVQEKLEFKRGEDGGASEVVSARIGSTWKKFRELSGVLVGKQSLSLKQQGKIYQ